MIINEDFFDGIDDVNVSDDTNESFDNCYTFSAYFSCHPIVKKEQIEIVFRLMNSIQKRFLEVFSISNIDVYDAVWMEYIKNDTTNNTHYIEQYGNLKIAFYTKQDEYIDGFFFYIHFDSDLNKISSRSLFKFIRNLDTIFATLSLIDNDCLEIFQEKYRSTVKMPQIFRRNIELGNPNLKLGDSDLLLTTNRSEDKLKNMYLFSKEWYDIAYMARMLNPECTYEKILIASNVNKFGNDCLKYEVKNNTTTLNTIHLSEHIDNTGHIEEYKDKLNLFTKRAYAEESWRHGIPTELAPMLTDENISGYYVYMQVEYNFLSFVFILDGTIELNKITLVPVLKTKSSVASTHLKSLVETAVDSQEAFDDYLNEYKNLGVFDILVDFVGNKNTLRKLFIDTKDEIQKIYQ